MLDRASLTLDDLPGLANNRLSLGALHAFGVGIGGGTTQIQRKILAEQVLGLPPGTAVAMDFEVSDDQLALQEGIAPVLRRSPPTRGGAATSASPVASTTPPGRSWPSSAPSASTSPRTSGGVGLAAIDAVLVYEVLGAGLVPGPVVAATLAAAVLPECRRGGGARRHARSRGRSI